MGDLTYIDGPRPASPVMVLAFSGWADAGEAATGTASYLQRRLDASPLAELDADKFCHLTADRPTALIEAGELVEMDLPRCEFRHAASPGGGADLVIFKGAEPAVNWEYFCRLVLGMAEELSARALLTLGGTYDYVPHCLDPVVSAVYSDRRARELFVRGRSAPGDADYHGSVSIHTLLLLRSRERGLPAAGLWGHSPVYIQSGNAKMHKRMAEMAAQGAGFDLDTSDLDERIREMDREIDELVENNPKLKRYVDEVNREYRSLEGGREQSRRRGGSRGKVISMDEFLGRRD